MSKYATAEQLVNYAPKRRYKEEVECPVSGFKLRIQSLMESELGKYDADTLTTKGAIRKSKLEDANRRLIVLCLVDDDGNRLLTDKQTHIFERWDSVDTKHLYKECAEHCGISEGDIEAMAKNSDATIDDDSATG